MRKLILLSLIFLAGPALASPPEWANNDKDRGFPGTSSPVAVTSESNALAAAAAVSTAEQFQSQSVAVEAVTGASTSSAVSGDSAANATGGDANVSVGAVSATLGSVVESGAVQSSTSVTSNYKEAAQAVSLVLTTACGTAAGASGREWTFSTAQGQDAFCKNLALANLYFSLHQMERGLQYVAAAEQLTEIDTFFDNLTTILTLGILK